MSKRPRTLDAFFSPPQTKRAHLDLDSSIDHQDQDSTETSQHDTYPFPVSHYPKTLQDALGFIPATEGRVINNQPHLDLLYFQPYIPKEIERDLFDFLRAKLFFYRVKYTIKRGPTETVINTPRFTTVFGLDDTAQFDQHGNVVDAKTKKPLPPSLYTCRPRPIPACLDELRVITENATDCKFNFALVNYYASGNDSISYHSDDERFLGVDPAIASFSLGAKRDFLLKHKPTNDKHSSETQPMKLPLASGDMILMKGRTQSNWLHSIPKRKSGEADKGRINITFRRAMVKGGTENYYRYNVGDGPAYRWDPLQNEMVLLKKGS